MLGILFVPRGKGADTCVDSKRLRRVGRLLAEMVDLVPNCGGEVVDENKVLKPVWSDQEGPAEGYMVSVTLGRSSGYSAIFFLIARIIFLWAPHWPFPSARNDVGKPFPRGISEFCRGDSSMPVE